MEKLVMNYEAAHTVPTVEVWGCLFLTYIHKFWVLARDNEIDVNCPFLITSLAGSGELQLVWLAGTPTPQYFADGPYELLYKIWIFQLKN